MTTKTVLIIDDRLHISWWLRGILDKMCEQYNVAPDVVRVEHCLPDEVRDQNQDYASIQSLETYLRDHAEEVTACLMDCGLGKRSDSRTLYSLARQGAPPFGPTFARVPTAMVTARAVDEARQEFAGRIFSKKENATEDLIEWLAHALGLVPDQAVRTDASQPGR